MTVQQDEHTRDDILFRPHQILHSIFLQVWIILLELVRECKRHDRKTSIVVGASFARLVRSLALLISVIALLAVDIADLLIVSTYTALQPALATYTTVPARMFQRATQQPSVRQRVFHYAPVAGEAEMDEIIVLRNNLCSRSGEVQSI